MSLVIKNKNSRKSKSSPFKSMIEGYTCIGSYEDKPKDCIYYFLHSEDNTGITGKYDCIVEYNHLKNKNTIVYQDGRMGRTGFSNFKL